MPFTQFPDPRKTGPEGLVALGGDLAPETLLAAYRQGIFPWPIEGAPALTWFCPPLRGILDFDELHIPRSLRTFQNKTPYRFTINQAFESVLDACARAYRPGQGGTWITPPMREGYLEFHRKGYAHSIEAWDLATETLVGGVYGVYVDGVFSGESMFHHQPNASKLALLYAIEKLRTRGTHWMDIQMLTPHMERLGAKEISRDDFLTRLSRTQELHRQNSANFEPLSE